MTALRNVALYFEPPSPSFFRDRMFDDDDLRPVGDHLMAPWAHLREVFVGRGIEVHTSDSLPQRPDGVMKLYFAVSRLEGYREAARRPDVVASAFVAMECPVVEPRLFRALPEVSKHFKRILSWSDPESLEPFVGARLKYEHFSWPQSFNQVHEEVWRRTDRKFLVMINANKLPRLYRNELYTERLRALEFFGQYNEIDLYGAGWNGPALRLGRTRAPYTFKRVQRKWQEIWDRVHPDPQLVAIRKVYRGVAPSKSEVLGQYNFAICFENMILKGWMTEKLFDCFFAGTVPVYWGAPDVTERVPPECFVDMRRFSGYDELRRYLKSLGPADILRFKENARDYLRSEKYKPFTKEEFAKVFVRIVEEDAGVKL
jgi:hypothetical protein